MGRATPNTGWTLLFFGRRSPLYGLVEIVFLWLAVAATVVLFFHVSRLAGAMLLPYLLWTIFATMLNFEIWGLNSETG